MTLAEYLAEVREWTDQATAQYREAYPDAPLPHYDKTTRTMLAIIEEQAKALREVMNVSGTSCLHYHLARDSLARIDALIAKGETK